MHLVVLDKEILNSHELLILTRILLHQLEESPSGSRHVDDALQALLLVERALMEEKKNAE